MKPKLKLARLANTTCFIFTLLAVGAPVTAGASPWVQPGDELTRHHLQLLVDSGAIGTPITSWPVMWSNIKSGLDAIDPSDLTAEQLWSYQYLKHELRNAMERFSFEQFTHVSNSPTAIGSFATDTREQRELGIGVNYTGERLALQVSASYNNAPLDDRRYRLDGSYISYLLGNWAVGLGAIDRWWGPGWESSMILSHNARPTPGIFLQRGVAAPFESAWLQWLGPWQLTTFMTRLESHRAVANPLLWGMRINFRPLAGLEIGLSRTAMWAGGDRPSDLDTFLRLLVGHDNRGDAGIDEEISETSNEPGNQLAGVDFRYGLNFKGLTPSIYGQLIGEDEAGGAPSRHIGMAGMELAGPLGDIHARISVEAHNSMVYFYESDKKSGNVAYEHSIYESGYRYRGRPLGAATDNDTEATTVRAQLYFNSGAQISASWSHLRINFDDSSAAAPGGNIFGAGETITDRWTLDFAAPLSDNTKIQVGAFSYSEDLSLDRFQLNSGGYLSLTARW